MGALFPRLWNLPAALIAVTCFSAPSFATSHFGLAGTLLVPISEPEIRGVGHEYSVHYIHIMKHTGLSVQLSRSYFPLEKDKVIKSLGFYSMEDETSWSFSGSYDVAEASLSLMLFGGEIAEDEFVPVLIGGIGYGTMRMDRNLKLIDDITGDVLEDDSGDASDSFVTFHAGGGVMMKVHDKIHLLLAVIYREMRSDDRPLDLKFQLGLYF